MTQTRRSVFGRLAALLGVTLVPTVATASAQRVTIGIDVDLLQPERRMELWQALRYEVQACRGETGITDEGEILCLLPPKEPALPSELRRLQRLWRSGVACTDHAVSS